MYQSQWKFPHYMLSFKSTRKIYCTHKGTLQKYGHIFVRLFGKRPMGGYEQQQNQQNSQMEIITYELTLPGNISMNIMIDKFKNITVGVRYVQGIYFMEAQKIYRRNFYLDSPKVSFRKCVSRKLPWSRVKIDETTLL